MFVINMTTVYIKLAFNVMTYNDSDCGKIFLLKHQKKF